VEGPLDARQGAKLLDEIQAWLCRGHRAIVLSLAEVSKIDAAGIGELARAYTLAVAAGGTLRITEPIPRVRELLDRVGLFDILTGSDPDEPL
jgi:anti-anti-sigma factor